MNALPGISVLIPTLNAERYLEGCLRSIREQDYPQDLIEILVADAGSTDSTLEIARRYAVDEVIPNPRLTGEGARAILNGLAGRELVLSIDSDNYLVGRDWLKRMAEPLQDDPTVFASEPLRWHYALDDPPLNRYFTLTGVNDPVSIFMGNYGRLSYITGRWTEYPREEEQRDGYLIAELHPGRVPTLGANGYLARTDIVREVSKGDYYFDIDAVAELVGRGHRRIAKVDVAIGHRFADDMRALRRKTRRRVEDFLHWRHLRTYPWTTAGRAALAKFVVSTVLVLPLLLQAYRGYRRQRDPAWLYHVPVCWQTLLVYAWAVATSPFRRGPHSRAGWTH